MHNSLQDLILKNVSFSPLIPNSERGSFNLPTICRLLAFSSPLNDKLTDSMEK